MLIRDVYNSVGRCLPARSCRALEFRLGCVREIADERVNIRPQQPLDDLQPRPPRAEEEIVEEAEGGRVRPTGNLQFWIFDWVHSGSKPAFPALSSGRTPAM